MEQILDDSTQNYKTIATTVDYVDEPLFAARAHLIPLPPPDNEDFVEAMRLLFRILQTARNEEVLLLYSTTSRWYPDLLAAAVMGIWPRRLRPVIVLTGDMWEPKRPLRHLFNRFLIKLADRAIDRYAVVSTAELQLFPRIWGVDPAKMRFCPWGVTGRDHEKLGDEAPPGNYIFVGGNTYRDYEPLLEAVWQLPEYHFLMATTCLQDRSDLPPNVVVRPVRYREYMALMRLATAVISPVRLGMRRTAGLLTFLNAMWLKKPTIVTDALGVRDYVQDGETGLIVDGTPDSYVKALRWILDPANRDRVAYLGEKAHQVVAQQFTFENHVIALLEVLDEAAQGAAAADHSSQFRINAA